MKSLTKLIEEESLKSVSFYRIFGIERLFQLLNDRSLTLVSPELWEDPYEEALQKVLEKEAQRSIYGLCWSTRSRSDALWRIYSPNNLGVRISTSIGRVVDAFCSEMNNLTTDDFYIGSVSYLPENPRNTSKSSFNGRKLSLSDEDFRRPVDCISDGIEDVLDTVVGGRMYSSFDVAKAFMMKRAAFDHESEMRMIYLNGQLSEGEKVLRVPVDPVKLISGIEIDPRMDNEVYKSLEKAVRLCLAPNEVKSISKSDLYEKPTQLIERKLK